MKVAYIRVSTIEQKKDLGKIIEEGENYCKKRRESLLNTVEELVKHLDGQFKEEFETKMNNIINNSCRSFKRTLKEINELINNKARKK